MRCLTTRWMSACLIRSGRSKISFVCDMLLKDILLPCLKVYEQPIHDFIFYAEADSKLLI